MVITVLSGVAQLVGSHPIEQKVVGLILSQGMYERQPIDVSLLFLPPIPSL